MCGKDLVKSNDGDKRRADFFAKPLELLFVDAGSAAFDGSVSTDDGLAQRHAGGHFGRPNEAGRVRIGPVEGFEVPDTFVGAVVLATEFRMVPFDPEPQAPCGRHLTHEPDGPSLAIFGVLNPVADTERVAGCGRFPFNGHFLAHEIRLSKFKTLIIGANKFQKYLFTSGNLVFGQISLFCQNKRKYSGHVAKRNT